ncbi:hypothetical protein O181_067626 [Austropuccinia psidii MF-1]|uniref:Uncharacterized protein n=1 Tax=Austropuccinia psidii MF-1 TaxID=1389203 RepID=A0A9Q3ETA2_9BASI|nr:hypothetical protein [Austropuccinia psidii MF-1]
MLQEDYAIPDEVITARLPSLFEKSEKRWYYGIRQTNGKKTWSWWKQEKITKWANDSRSPNKPFSKKDKPKEAFNPNTSNSNEQRKCHKCGGIGNLANNCLKKEKINEIVETEDNNDKEEASDSEKDTEESETSERDEINIINAQIDNIYLIFEVMEVKSNLPQVRTSDTNLKNIQAAKLYRTKPEEGLGYTAGKSSISIVRVGNHEAKVNLDTGAYCNYVGKSDLKIIVPDWEEKRIQIQGVKFSTASESMNPLGIIDLKLIFPHP